MLVPTAFGTLQMLTRSATEDPQNGKLCGMHLAQQKLNPIILLRLGRIMRICIISVSRCTVTSQLLGELGTVSSDD